MYEFKQNKYYKIYKNLIEKANKDKRSKQLDNQIYEEHHIIPKSLKGSNKKVNLVLLTPREHFIAHLLLVRIVKREDVYRMVGAIRRFMKYSKNSKQYENARLAISRFGKGEFNPSYGKVWCYLKEDISKILYVKKEEFDEETMIRGLPNQRGGFKNYQYVNDGKSEFMIPKNQNIPEGWSKGRLFKPSIEQSKAAAKARHTKEKDKEHSKKLLGRIAIFKNEKQIRIQPSDFLKYYSDGWILMPIKNKRKNQENIDTIKSLFPNLY